MNLDKGTGSAASSPPKRHPDCISCSESDPTAWLASAPLNSCATGTIGKPDISALVYVGSELELPWSRDRPARWRMNQVIALAIVAIAAAAPIAIPATAALERLGLGVSMDAESVLRRGR